MEGPVEHQLLIKREGGLLTLTLDNPPQNKLTDDLLRFLDSTLDGPAKGCNLIIFTGKGKSFSHGFDLAPFRSCTDPRLRRQKVERANRVINRISESGTPALAAINGPCFGGGLELALACHFRVCADKARLGLPEVSKGLLPGLGGIHRLARIVGNAKALEMVALGDLIPADEALRLNLVSRVYPRDDFMSHVRSLARTLLMVEPSLMSEVLDLLRRAPERTNQENTRAAVKSFVRFSSRVKK